MGAGFMKALVTNDASDIELYTSQFSTEELLTALVPQVRALARRLAEDRGVTLTELGDRFLRAAQMFEHMGLDGSS